MTTHPEGLTRPADDSRALSAQETNVGAPHGAIRARQGEGVAGVSVPDSGAVGRIRTRHDQIVTNYGGEPWDDSCIEDGEQAHMDRGNLLAIVSALETENAQHVHQIECMRQELRGRDQTIAALIKGRDELVLALMWCRPRLKHQAYISHVDWTLTKYPKPPVVDEPRIVRSEDYRDFCPSDPRGPGRTGGE